MEVILSYSNWLILVALAVGGWFVVRRAMSNAGPQLKAATLERGVAKEIKRLAKEGNLLGAGDAAFQAEAYLDAADFFVQGKDFVRAADAYMKAGKRNEAVTFYKKAGQYKKAATLYEKAGQIKQAAQEYLQCGETVKAAELFIEAKDFRRAAELYEELGQFSDAGEAYERVGDREAATKAYERYLEAEVRPDRAGRSGKLPQKAREKVVFVAKSYEEAQEYAKAAKLMQQVGQLEKAAELLLKAKEPEQAAKLFLDARKPEQAAKVFESVGDRVRASLYRGEAAAQEGRAAEAAHHFEKAGKHSRAAELYAEAGETLKSAKAYEAAEEFRSAADQYQSLGDNANAARCMEESGDYRRASELYEAVNNAEGVLRCLEVTQSYFELGSFLMRQQRPKEALAYLQRLDKLDPNFREAVEVQGDILSELGQFAVALEKYKAAVAETEPNTTNLSAFYKLGLCLERTGEVEEAIKVFDRVLVVDYYYKDAQTKAEKLRQASASKRAGGGLPNMGGGGGPKRYEVLDEIARGGMGVVYRARDTVLNRVVAYKILSENLKTNPTAVKYFLREAKAAASMSHPNIVTVYDAGEQEGEYYMAMELVQGETLKSLITRSGPFHEKLVRFILVHACRGMAYAHSKNIVHRDIKSGNMMLTKDKTLKLMDFGLAKHIEQYQSQHTKAIGTPFYMSPEQILGRDLDQRSDLYSLGITLFECSTGTVPFYKGELSYHHLHTAPPKPTSLNPNISPTMEQIIMKLLEKDPNKRYSSALEILKALRVQ